MPTVPDSTPYPWPWDGCNDMSRLAVVVCGVHPSPETGTGAGSEGERPVPLPDQVGLLVDECRTSGVTVIWLEGHSSAGRNPLATDSDERVATTGVDGFYSSALDHTLRRRSVTSLLLCGWGLETTLHSTIRSANDRGYECLLVEDACGALDESLRPAAISTIEMSGGIFGAVATTEATAEYLRRARNAQIHGATTVRKDDHD